MDSDGGNQRQLTSVEKNSSDDQVSVTSDDRFLVFQSDRSGTPQIWRANRDGTDLTKLTQDGDNEEPAVTPDGNSVVYSHLHEGMSTLWEISISGQESRQLTTDYASWPAISPDGRFVAFADGKPIVSVYKGLAVTRIDGGQRVKFFSVPASGVLYNRPEWSADGKSIIYKDDEQGLWRQELDKDNPTHLVGADNFRITHFALSGTDLIYAGGTTKRDIVIIDNHR
jgi:Tol biopolymer transport system component